MRQTNNKNLSNKAPLILCVQLLIRKPKNNQNIYRNYEINPYLFSIKT